MNFCLVDNNNKAYEGDSLRVALEQTNTYVIDYEKRRAVILYNNIGADTVSYSPDYTSDEMESEIRKRVLNILIRSGWRFYRNT
jgi:hypothetical protein